MKLSDMLAQLSRSAQDFEARTQHLQLLAIGQRHIDRADAFVGRCADSGAAALLEGGDAAGVVGMMVGDQDIGEAPVRMGVEPGQDGGGIAGIDHDRLSCRGVLDQPDVVIVESGQRKDVEHGRALWSDGWPLG